MSSTVDAKKNPPDVQPSSLGGILYSQVRGPRPSEAEWAALVGGIASGDQRALRALFQRAHRIVFTLVLRIVNSPESAEELTVDTFHEVWRRAGGYDAAEGSVIAWIMNIARSRAIDRVRFEQRKKRIDPRPDAPQEMPEDSPPEIIELKEQDRQLHNVLGVLTPEEQQVIKLAFFGENTYAEVAERLSLPLGTVKTRIRSGLTKLRLALAEEGRR